MVKTAEMLARMKVTALPLTQGTASSAQFSSTSVAVSRLNVYTCTTQPTAINSYM